MNYAGIGSRSTPIDVLKRMRTLAEFLESVGHICHTGGALGADKAFIDGAPDTTVLWLPFDNYNGYESNKPGPGENEIKFAEKYHPNWKACNERAKLMHARNCNIILGEDLKSPVDFVICWTPEGKLEGGTAQGLRIAIDYDIPIFNLGYDMNQVLNDLQTFLDTGYYSPF